MYPAAAYKLLLDVLWTGVYLATPYGVTPLLKNSIPPNQALLTPPSGVVYHEICTLLASTQAYSAMAHSRNLFGLFPLPNTATILPWSESLDIPLTLDAIHDRFLHGHSCHISITVADI